MSDDRFLERWSRRKRAADADDRGEAPSEDHIGATPSSATTDGSPPVDVTEEDGGLTDVELCDKFGLPDPGSMEKGDDFKAFFAAGVPARLRNLALRRLWRVNPALGRLDDLIDYADDYTDAATALGAAQTTYEVGQGLRAHVEKLSTASRDEIASSDAAADGSSPAAEEPEEATAEDSEKIANPASGNLDDEMAERPQDDQVEMPVDVDPAVRSKTRENATDRPRRMVFRSGNLPNK